MTKSHKLLSLLEQEFEFRQVEDILATLRKLEPGEYDLSGVEAVFTTSKDKANIDEVQTFISRYHRVCYIIIEGYSDKAKDLILLSDEPRKISASKPVKDEGIIIYKNRLFANNLDK